MPRRLSQTKSAIYQRERRKKLRKDDRTGHVRRLPSSEKRKLTSLYLSEAEFEMLDQIADSLGLTHRSHAMRAAIRQAWKAIRVSAFISPPEITDVDIQRASKHVANQYMPDRLTELQALLKIGDNEVLDGEPDGEPDGDALSEIEDEDVNGG